MGEDRRARQLRWIVAGTVGMDSCHSLQYESQKKRESQSKENWIPEPPPWFPERIQDRPTRDKRTMKYSRREKTNEM